MPHGYGPKILLVEDDAALVELLVYHFEREDFEVAHTAGRRGGAAARAREPARPRHARLDARRAVRDRGLPPTAPHARDRQRADHHADRARRGGRPDPRPRDRRRRLCHQALLAARAGRPGARGAAPGAAGAGRRAAGLCRYRDGRGRPQGEARRRARSRSAPPSSACSRISSNIPAGSSRASGCSIRSGARTATSRSRTVDVHIRRLRKAINGARPPDIIRTVRSAGYALDTGA